MLRYSGVKVNVPQNLTQLLYLSRCILRMLLSTSSDTLVMALCPPIPKGM